MSENNLNIEEALEQINNSCLELSEVYIRESKSPLAGCPEEWFFISADREDQKEEIKSLWNHWKPFFTPQNMIEIAEISSEIKACEARLILGLESFYNKGFRVIEITNFKAEEIVPNWPAAARWWPRLEEIRRKKNVALKEKDFNKAGYLKGAEQETMAFIEDGFRKDFSEINFVRSWFSEKQIIFNPVGDGKMVGVIEDFIKNRKG